MLTKLQTFNTSCPVLESVELPYTKEHVSIKPSLAATVQLERTLIRKNWYPSFPPAITTARDLHRRLGDPLLLAMPRANGNQRFACANSWHRRENAYHLEVYLYRPRLTDQLHCISRVDLVLGENKMVDLWPYTEKCSLDISYMNYLCRFGRASVSSMRNTS